MATNLESEVKVSDFEYQHGFLARIYQPQGTGPFAAVMDIHGGAWNQSDRLGNAGLDQAIAAGGILVVAIDFHQPPVAGYPDSIADTNLGIRWLKAHAAEFSGRPETVGLLGTSSGGHMGMLSALRPRDPRYCALTQVHGDATVKYVVACWPILDPSARYEMAQQTGKDLLVKFHDTYWGTEEAMSEGNPTRILERGEPVETPPVLIIQGTNDANVTPDMADRFASAYKSRGGSVQLQKYEGMPHGFIGQKPDAPESQDAILKIVAFIKEQSK